MTAPTLASMLSEIRSDLREVRQYLCSTGCRPPQRYASILSLCAEANGVSVAQMLGPGRPMGCVWARAEAAHLLAQIHGLSDTEVARLFSKSDRSSVRHWRKIIADRLSTEPSYAAHLTGLRNQI